MNRPLISGLLIVLIGNTAAPGSEPARAFADGLFVSEASPALKVRIDPAFRYLGHDAFILKEKAAVERHHWVNSRDGEIQAMIVFQFESLLDGVEGGYEFAVPGQDVIAGSNYRFSPSPVRLGDEEYIHNTWAFDNRASAEENPGAESARTLELLRQRGYRIDDGLIMSRYVRAVGKDQRREIILFYMEPLRRSGHIIDELPDGGPPTEVYDRLSADVTARGRAAFEVLMIRN